ncbi:hypothetical protein OH76DRAFT_564654 [Lentinus brumalis]|uniref:Uncharacterized protein n=1 Tax=Lentinus brumalis TaxID=2498619 RepID=A0A371DTA1_9APHY|nr:hypothetical protein OH76DRAFT_564654 [Polyporus brumalis]
MGVESFRQGKHTSESSYAHYNVLRTSNVQPRWRRRTVRCKREEACRREHPRSCLDNSCAAQERQGGESPGKDIRFALPSRVRDDFRHPEQRYWRPGGRVADSDGLFVACFLQLYFFVFCCIVCRYCCTLFISLEFRRSDHAVMIRIDTLFALHPSLLQLLLQPAYMHDILQWLNDRRAS